MAPRILIIRLSALGDIIHALPLLAAIRDRWADAHVGWLCEPAGAPLLEGHPLINRLHVAPRGAWKQGMLSAVGGPKPPLVGELREERYEVALDVQGLTKSALWPWLARIPRRLAFHAPDARELSGPLATERVRPSPQRRHVAERNLALLGPLGIDVPESISFPVHLPDAAKSRAVEILDGDNTPLVIMNPGAGWETKIWPPERYGELARRLIKKHECRVALAWGPGEERLVTRAAGDTATDRGAAFNRAHLDKGPGLHILPATSFVKLSAVLAHARLFVGGDTGPTHMAAALGVPTVSMMGPLDARRNGPHGAHCTTIQHAIPRRAPFWRNHRSWCDPRTDLRRVGVDEVYEACEASLRPAERD